ncbi:MAG: DUF3592 domain-containing protein [Planctomycetia bacterium]
MRLPQFYAKKRGHRQTGSREWGVFGDGLFHGTLLAAGLFFGALLVFGVAAPEWRLNHEFRHARGTILAKGLARTTVADPPGTVMSSWRPCLLLRYAVDGIERESWSQGTVGENTALRETALRRLDAWKLGAETDCWYDPAAPRIVVLKRGYNWWLWLLSLLLPGALVLIGGTGLLRGLRSWGKSEEHLAASAGLSELLDPLAQPTPAAPGYPAVPVWDDLVNSPGTILRYRLPIESPENWTLVGFGLFALLWNAVVVVLAVGAGFDLIGGKTDLWLLALLVPFVGVGIGGIALFVRSLVLATAIGPTQLEISDHPLVPGSRYDVLLAQGGGGTLRSLALSLELEEQATFRQGTDTRTEQLVVWRRPVAEFRGVNAEPQSRFETRAVVDIPADAMHSFTSAHNAVRWRLVVRGTPERWPAFTRVFPVVIFSPEAAARERPDPIPVDETASRTTENPR